MVVACVDALRPVRLPSARFHTPFSLPIEPDDREANITGAKGLGEPVTIPTAAAVANAVYHATGVRVRQTPINPVQLCRLLAEHRKER